MSCWMRHVNLYGLRSLYFQAIVAEYYFILTVLQSIEKSLRNVLQTYVSLMANVNRCHLGAEHLSTLTLTYIYKDSFDFKSIATNFLQDLFLTTPKTCCTIATNY